MEASILQEFRSMSQEESILSRYAVDRKHSQCLSQITQPTRVAGQIRESHAFLSFAYTSSVNVHNSVVPKELDISDDGHHDSFDFVRGHRFEARMTEWQR